jgi:peptidoglycan-associated lipoprotein
MTSGQRAFNLGRVILRICTFGLIALVAGCSESNKNVPSAGLLGSDGYGNGGYGKGGRAIPGTVEDFRSGARDTVYFSSDSSDLTPEASQTLSQQARWLQQYPQHPILIEGHADERGTREYNLALGARRAQSVRSYLAAQGVPHARMRTISYGKERPVAVCDDITCWSQNRRAQTTLGGAAISQR